MDMAPGQVLLWKGFEWWIGPDRQSVFYKRVDRTAWAKPAGEQERRRLFGCIRHNGGITCACDLRFWVIRRA